VNLLLPNNPCRVLARVSAVEFYEKLGYAIVGGEFVEVTIPHRKMEKSVQRTEARDAEPCH